MSGGQSDLDRSAIEFPRRLKSLHQFMIDLILSVAFS
jgi:hypothetical protein